MASFTGILQAPDQIEVHDDTSGSCFSLATEDGDECFSITAFNENCFFINHRGTYAPNEAPELDLSEWVRIVFCVFFSSADRLFVLGNDYEGNFLDNNYMYEFTYIAGTHGGIKEITGLATKTLAFIAQEDNSNTDMWMRGWGSTFTPRELAYRYTHINIYDTLTTLTYDGIADVSVNKTYSFFGENQLVIGAEDGSGTAEWNVFYSGDTAHCQEAGSIDTPHVFWKAYNRSGVLQNTDFSFWGMKNTITRAIYYDNRGGMLCVAEGRKMLAGDFDTLIMLDASHGTIVEPIRRLTVYDAGLSWDEDVCSYCILSSTFVSIPASANNIHFVDYTGRYLTIMFTNGSEDGAVYCIDTFKMKQGQETPLEDVLMSVRNVNTDYCLANEWMLEVKGDGSAGLITQESMLVQV